MRLVLAAAALVLLSLAPRAAAARPSVRGATTIGLGMRGNQGGVLVGGFRLVIAAGVVFNGVNVVVELDRQIGPDNLIEDASDDAAHWYEWVLAARSGRRFALVKGLSVLTTGGFALVHATVTATTGGEVDRSNLGLEVGAALMWQSASLVVIVGTGATVVPFSQHIDAGPASFDLPARIEPTANLGIGFVY